MTLRSTLFGRKVANNSVEVVTNSRTAHFPPCAPMGLGTTTWPRCSRNAWSSAMNEGSWKRTAVMAKRSRRHLRSVSNMASWRREDLCSIVRLPRPKHSAESSVNLRDSGGFSRIVVLICVTKAECSCDWSQSGCSDSKFCLMTARLKGSGRDACDANYQIPFIVLHYVRRAFEKTSTGGTHETIRIRKSCSLETHHCAGDLTRRILDQ